MTGRFLVMLVVLTAVVATRQPALAQPAPVPAGETPRSAWTDRLAVGISRTITSTALLQRIAFTEPRPPLRARFDFDTRPVRPELPDPYRFGLPPPQTR